MKTIKLIIKGVLFYTTLLFSILFVSSVDAVYDAGYFIPALIINIVLIVLCCKLISTEDLDLLTLNKLFNE